MYSFRLLYCLQFLEHVFSCLCHFLVWLFFLFVFYCYLVVWGEMAFFSVSCETLPIGYLFFLGIQEFQGIQNCFYVKFFSLQSLNIMWWCKFISNTQVCISLGCNFLIVALFPSYSQLWSGGKLSQGFPKSLTGQNFSGLLFQGLGQNLRFQPLCRGPILAPSLIWAKIISCLPIWILKPLSPIIKAYNLVQNLASALVYTLALSFLFISCTWGFLFLLSLGLAMY